MRFDHRLRRLIGNVFGTAAARSLNLLITLAMVPLTINALSLLDYAVFSIALSITVFSGYADLGLGLAVVNRVASAVTQPSRTIQAKRAVSIVWYTLLAVAAACCCVTGIVALGFNLLGSAEVSYFNAILIGIACVFAGLPTGLVQRLLFACQQSTEANLWATGARFASLLFVLALVYLDIATLERLIFGVVGIPALVGWLSVVLVFRRDAMKAISPSWPSCDIRLLKPYLMAGASFFIMQMIPYAETGIDNVIAGGLIGIEVVPALDVYTKLFSYIVALVSIGIFPLWPAIASAHAAKDAGWILRIRKWVYLLVAAISAVAASCFVVYGDHLVLAWTRQPLQMDAMVLYGMAVFAVLSAIGTTQVMILSGVGIIKAQVKIYVVYAVLLLLAKSFAASYSGLAAMVWSVNICYLVRLCLAERAFHQSKFMQN